MGAGCPGAFLGWFGSAGQGEPPLGETEYTAHTLITEMLVVCMCVQLPSQVSACKLLGHSLVYTQYSPKIGSTL